MLYETYLLGTSEGFVHGAFAIGVVPSFARTMRHKNRALGISLTSIIEMHLICCSVLYLM